MASVVPSLPILKPGFHGRTAVYQDDWQRYADGQTWRLVIGEDLQGPTPSLARKRAHNWAGRQPYLVKCQTRLVVEDDKDVLYVEFEVPGAHS